MSAELLAAAGGLFTAMGTIIIGVLSTRSKVKLDDIATMQKRLDVAEEKLTTEREARAADSQRLQAQHDSRIAVLEVEITSLRDRLAQRDRTITHLDRIVLALRTYVARLRHRLVDNEIGLPDEPEGMDDN